MTSTDTAPKKTRKPRALASAAAEAAPLVPTLPADLDAMDRQVNADDELAAAALLRGSKARREMVDEIAMLRRQVETLTTMNGDLVAGLKTFEEGYKSGEPRFVPLFALTPQASDQAQTLKTERESHYARRMEINHVVDTIAGKNDAQTPAERRIEQDIADTLAGTHPPRQPNVSPLDLLVQKVDDYLVPEEVERIAVSYRHAEGLMPGDEVLTPGGMVMAGDLISRWKMDPKFRAVAERYLGDFAELLGAANVRGEAGAYLRSETGKVYIVLSHVALQAEIPGFLRGPRPETPPESNVRQMTPRAAATVTAGLALLLAFLPVL